MRKRDRDITRTVRAEGLTLIALSHRGTGHLAVTVEGRGQVRTVTAASTPGCPYSLRAFRRELRREMGAAR